MDPMTKLLEIIENFNKRLSLQHEMIVLLREQIRRLQQRVETLEKQPI